MVEIAVPCWTLYVSMAILYWTRSGTRSQCRPTRASVMWSERVTESQKVVAGEPHTKGLMTNKVESPKTKTKTLHQVRDEEKDLDTWICGSWD